MPPTNRAGALVLSNSNQKTNYDCEKGNPFNEGGSQNHVRSDVPTCFGLASDRFQRPFTNVTDTKTRTNSGDTSTNASTHLANRGQIRSCL